jgi:hypothetical protein
MVSIFIIYSEIIITTFSKKVDNFVPKSKKGNEIWTFLKCPFLKREKTFAKT